MEKTEHHHGNGELHASIPVDQEERKEVSQEAHKQEAVGINADVVNKLLHTPRPHVLLEEFKFGFRTTKEEKKNEKGEVVKGEDGKPVIVEHKRADIKLMLPVPTIDGLVEALQDEKQLTYVLGILKDEIYKAARMQVGDEEKPVNSQEELDLSKLTLHYLANQPPAERRGGGISKETWEAFAKDYIEVMPAVINKDADKVSNAAKILLAKFQPVKTNKPVIKVLKEYLSLWFSNSPNAEEFQECYDFLDSKADALLKVSDEELLTNL